ncbi:MAG: A/G-specific adenine glycosylase [Deltaproteobacteria bacterium]|nr:A/G-specific adenine glycosylase [Deltaproteobacteria bacterium]
MNKNRSVPIYWGRNHAKIPSAINADATSIIPETTKIRTKLLRWFKRNERDLPWRKTKDPYAIWVSEIMLQQTQVATVIPYYEKFLKTFPTIQSLAQAHLSKVLKVWEGLGYYSRARNLHQASRLIEKRFKGKIPDNLKDLLDLPGIGRYTAGAILSIVFNKTVAILDGNVKRVLSRLYAISGNPAISKTEDLLWHISESLVPKGRASLFNQAIMDLGAMICTPKDPQCPKCPLIDLCKAYGSGKPERFPSKAMNKKIPHIESVAAVIRKDRKVLLRQRPLRGLLGGLWEFPNWKIHREERLRLRLRKHIKDEFGMNVKVKESVGTFQQIYSHFKLTLFAFYCDGVKTNKKGRWVPIPRLRLLPMSRIDRKIADTIQESPLQNKS